jgi:L-lactate dehydrogenase complex protein LldG
MTVRDDILKRLRKGSESAPVVLPAPYALGAESDDPVQRFITRATAAGMAVTTVSIEDLSGALIRAVVSAGASTVAMWEDPLLTPVQGAFEAMGISVLRPADQDKAQLALVQVGITTAVYAAAETATLALDCSPQRPRGTSLLPPLHLLVLPQHRILPTLTDLFRRIPSLPSAFTLISGPSRSADIELTTVRGVHGPTAVSVYLVP